GRRAGCRGAGARRVRLRAREREEPDREPLVRPSGCGARPGAALDLARPHAGAAGAGGDRAPPGRGRLPGPRGPGVGVGPFQRRALAPEDLSGAYRLVLIGATAPSFVAGTTVPVDRWDDV